MDVERITNEMCKEVSEEAWLHEMAALKSASNSGNAIAFVIVASTA